MSAAVRARIRAKLIDTASVLLVVGLVYAALSVATSAFTMPVPISGDVLVLLGWVMWKTAHGLDSIPGLVAAVRRYRRDREAHAQDGVFADYGVVYRIGSPPSHAAGGVQ